MASWFGHATQTWTSSPNTISLPLKSNSTQEFSSQTNTRSLLSLCQSSTPPCTLNPLLPGGDVQTIYGAVLKRKTALLHYKRRIFESDSKLYPGCFAVDFVTKTPRAEDVEEVNPRTAVWEEQDWERYCGTGAVDATEKEESIVNKPILVALHGISGGSHELYLRETVEPLAMGMATNGSEGKVTEWDVLVVNARGCANSPNQAPRLFNSRATWDVRQLVKWLRDRFPERPIFAIGFSLGANILVNYLGEEGANTPVSAAVICSNPWNLEASSLALQRSWFGRELYLRSLTANMKKLFEKHVDAISKNPGIDVEKVRNSRYLPEFDRHLQCPSWGYPTEGAYYRDASSVETVMTVRVPMFIIHAEDDPIAPKEVLPFEEIKLNPYAVMCSTDMGGHLSWFEWGGGRWMVKPASNFLRAMASDVDYAALRANITGSAIPVEPDTGSVDFDPLRRKLHIPS